MRLEPIRFPPAAPVVARALEAARIAAPMTVSETALRYVVLDNPGGGYCGPMTFDRAPHLRRPMDCLTADSGYWLTAVMGPSQCGKSTIGDIWQLHSTVVDPADIIAVWPDKDIARSYVTTYINKMIRLSPELRALQLQTASADNIFSKEFKGSNWFHVWPVPSQLRARPVPRFRVEDFDAVPEDIGGGAKARGEGGVIMLLTGRQTTFEGHEIGYINSSPARGALAGIEAQVAAGTDETWYVDCLQCGEPFDLAPERLQFEDKGSAEDARASAVVICDAHGCAHDHAEKSALMATGRWIGRGQTPVTGGTDGELLTNRVAGFRITGLMGFATWPRLAELHRGAEIAFEAAQDEGELRAFFQSRMGVNYKSVLDGADPVTADELVERAEGSGYAIGEVPDGVVCLTAAVDVQGNRFEVMVKGWFAGFESCVIDRFAILALDDGTTAIDPARRPEHWHVLLRKVIWRKYPLARDRNVQVSILNTAIDTGGSDGVTENAFAFWYAAHHCGVPATGITLVKGGNNPKAKLIPPVTLDAKRKARKGDPDAELWVPNVHRFKDMIDVRLRRAAPGPGHIHLPRDMERRHLDEATAEIKENGLWVRIRGRANETLDLLVYCTVALMRLGGNDSSLRWVPEWARVPVQAAPPASPDDDTPGAPPSIEDALPPRPRGRSRPRIRTRG